MAIIFYAANYTRKWETERKPTILTQVLDTLCGELNNRQARWSAPVLFTALDCLRQLSNIAAAIQKASEPSIVIFISRCCEFFKTKSKVLRDGSPPIYLDALIASAYSCLIEWLVVAPWILRQAPLIPPSVRRI